MTVRTCEQGLGYEVVDDATEEEVLEVAAVDQINPLRSVVALEALEAALHHLAMLEMALSQLASS